MLLEKNVSYTLLILLVLFVAVFFWKDSTFGSSAANNLSYRITTEYFGASAEEVERVITIPLENTLGDIPGITRIQSCSEFAKSRITLIAGKQIPGDILFGDIRERVERTRIQFPAAVQKPHIVSSDASNNPVYIVSFHPGLFGLSGFGEYADRTLKTMYQRVPGTGEIEIGGRGVQETIIVLDNDRATQYETDTLTLSEILQQTIVRKPVGEFTETTQTIPLLFDSNFSSLKDFRLVRIPSQNRTFTTLNEIASITQRYRKPHQISRINGEKRITLYIYAGASTNPLLLCRKLDNVTNKVKAQGFSPEVVYNKGQELEKNIRKILVSMLISMTTIFLFIGVFIPGLVTRIVFALSIPLSLFLGTSILSGMNIPLDTGILSGLIIGSGLIIDNYLVVYNHVRSENTANLRPLVSPLLAATMTTILAFLPLILARTVDATIASIAMSLSVLLIVSLCLSFTFLKKPLLWSLSATEKKPIIALSKIAQPLLHMTKLPIRTPLPFFGVYIGIVVLTLILLAFSEKEFSTKENPGILFTHVEFPSGTTITEIDTRIQPYSAAFRQIDHVRTVETSAKRGNAQIRITFDPEALSAAELADTIKPLTESSTQGQFFVGMNQNLDNYRIRLTITGPDHLQLKKEITRIGHDLSGLPWVSGVIYHFKEDPPSFIFSPHLYRLRHYERYPDKFAQILRWNIQHPVSLKWLVNEKEQDVRISGDMLDEGLFSLESIPVITAENSSIRIGNVGSLSIQKEPDTLFRENRQNSISLSILTERIGLQKVQAFLQDALSGTTLPNGYGIFIDPAIKETIETYQHILLVLCVAVFLIYILLAIQAESITKPFVIISVIPFCSFSPLLLLLVAGIPVTASVLVGLTVLSGMSVNNYILIIDALDKDASKSPLQEKIHRAIKKRFMPLFLSSGTSVLAAIPILFTADPFSSTPSALAVIVSLGLLGSFLGAFLFLPAVLLCTNKVTRVSSHEDAFFVHHY